MSKWSYEDVQFMGYGGNQLPVDQIEQVKSAMEQRDNPIEAMLCLDREFDQLPFLDSNIDYFMDSGVYEEALVDIYVCLRMPCKAWAIETWEYFFSMADEEKLMMARNIPFSPASPTFNIYRGCIQDGIRAISWTMDEKKASWFASIYEKNLAENTGVYEFTVSLDQVAFCANDREEFEVVLNPCTGILDAIEQEAQLIK